VRVSEELELLDAPGIIPGRLNNQAAAIKLAICDDIGEASYDRQRVTAAMIELIKELGYAENLQAKYDVDPLPMTGEDYIRAIADKQYLGDMERSAHNLLNNFRTGGLGPIGLDMPPMANSIEDD
jgi:ribosome biogenesis GTPase A